MTYIEFFDDDAVVNVCACLAHAPKRVVILGDKLKRMQRHAKRYRELFAQRGQQIEFVCRSINRNNLQSIVDALTGILERNGLKAANVVVRQMQRPLTLTEVFPRIFERRNSVNVKV